MNQTTGLRRVFPWLLLLYVTALHTSMAGMEILGWTIVLCSAVYEFAGASEVRASGLSLLRANRWLLIWLGGMTVSVLIGLLAVPQEKTFLFQIGFMRFIILLWGVTFALREAWSEEFESRLIPWWMFVAFCAGAYGVMQCLTGVDFLRTGVVVPQGGGSYRAVGFFSLSMTFAYSLGVSLFAISLPAMNSRHKAFGLLTVTGAALGVVSSMSRGAWLAMVICILIYLGFTRRQWLLPALMAFVLAASGLTVFSEGFGRKILGLAQFHIDHSSLLRLGLWRSYWHMFLDHPLTGIGLLDGDKLVPYYYAQLGIDETFVSHAHNNFLQWLAGAGILGFVSYVAVSFIILRKAWRLRLVSTWGWSIFLAQIFLHLGGLTEANFINAAVNHMLMFTWAIALVLEERALGKAQK